MNIDTEILNNVEYIVNLSFESSTKPAVFMNVNSIGFRILSFTSFKIHKKATFCSKNSVHEL